jgi:flagellar hook-associated protein 1 FlgK
MSLGAALATALSGLGTAQRALALTANNVSNVNTPGFVRKGHQQSSLVVDGRGAGVVADDPRREVDEFVRAELRAQRSRVERNAALEAVHERLGISRIGAVQTGLPATLDRLREAVEGAATNPEKLPARTAVTGALDDVLAELRETAALVQTLRREQDRRVGDLVAETNDVLVELEQLNRQLARGLPPGELADRRDALLDRLAGIMEIKTAFRADGGVSVFARGGQTLLDTAARTLVYQPAAAVTATTSFDAVIVYAPDQIDPATGLPLAGEIGVELVSDGVRATLPPELAGADPVVSRITGGELAGRLDARDALLPELADMLGELGSVLAHALNAAHNDAVPHPPPTRLEGTRTDTSAFDPLQNGGTAYVAVIDRSTGATLATAAVDPTAATPAALAAQLAADLAPFATAGFDAAGRLVIETASAGHGVALDEGDSRIAVTDAAGHAWDCGFAHYFGLNDLVVGDPAGGFSVRGAVAADPTRLAAVVLTVDPGPPPVGVAGGSGDNRGLQGLAASFDRRVETVARGPLPATNSRIGDYLADLVGITATQAARTTATGEAGRALVAGLEERDASVAGVNLDEEMAKLVLYQQAYTTAARVIQITDELFDELLSIKR